MRQAVNQHTQNRMNQHAPSQGKHVGLLCVGKRPHFVRVKLRGRGTQVLGCYGWCTQPATCLRKTCQITTHVPRAWCRMRIRNCSAARMRPGSRGIIGRPHLDMVALLEMPGVSYKQAAGGASQTFKVRGRHLDRCILYACRKGAARRQHRHAACPAGATHGWAGHTECLVPRRWVRSTDRISVVRYIRSRIWLCDWQARAARLCQLDSSWSWLKAEQLCEWPFLQSRACMSSLPAQSTHNTFALAAICCGALHTVG